MKATVFNRVAAAMMYSASRRTALENLPPAMTQRRLRGRQYKGRKTYIGGFNKEREMERRRRQSATVSLRRAA